MNGYIEQAYKGKNEWWRYLLTIIRGFYRMAVIWSYSLFMVAFNESDDLVQLMAVQQMLLRILV